MKKKIICLIADETNLSEQEVENLLEVPPSIELGDYSFPCFSLARIKKKSPVKISEEIVKKLKNSLVNEISKIESKGPYVNIFIDKSFLAKEILLKDILNFKLDNKRIGIEYPSPNTNKPLHVGHLRNMAIGDSISRICSFVGNKVFHLNLFNDRGILISKSIVGYELYSKGKTPSDVRKEGDVFVGDLYVQFSKASKEDESLEELAKDKLRKWEAGDKKVLELWSKMNAWTYEGMNKTFKKFGLLNVDKNYYESELYLKGKKIIEQGIKNGLFSKKKDGAVFINLEKDKLGEKILIRKDGTSVYMTTDLYLAKLKIEDFDLDSSYYVVGNDQEYHFKVLFNILNKLGFKKDWRHLSYGMVTLPEGKMKSREGTAVSAEDLIEDTKKLALEGLKQRDASGDDLKERALKISLAAIKYHLLKVDYRKKIVFNPKEALAFEGDTGPYLLYSYARASSIIRKVKQNKEVTYSTFQPIEILLLKKIGNFEEVVKKAYLNSAPNLIANYSYSLAKLFNEFYHSCPVVSSDNEGFRLKLVDKFRDTLKVSLNLLGIEVLEEM